jgi:hypothetical protein
MKNKLITMILRLLLSLIVTANGFIATQAQTVRNTSYKSETPAKKPYKILTNGKQITVKGSSTIKTIMVWTSSGHRIVEQKAVNANNYTFRISVNEKIFFIMLRMENGAHFTEKIGVN